MERHDIINILSKGAYSDYLEIGVEAGDTFNKVNIRHKVAVDPDFKIPVTQLQGAAFPITSDSFFSANNAQFDCIFLDGLHLYEQVRRDFMNAWGRIKPGGIILIDDCYPSDAFAAMRDHTKCHHLKIARGDTDRNWMGDVYKLVAWINDFTEARYSFIDDTMGIVAVWNERQKRPKWFGTEALIDRLSYEDFVKLPLPSLSVEAIAERLKISSEFRDDRNIVQRIVDRLSKSVKP
ncbi:class I SAM-dependent methyltransferase [Asticcacaulis sp. EMRT-3]|uniref:class I SAM-dependent methyltransferase n=1 Tax=Asticcacaulis sp. EMRT-3 TaxID=3040349 RepID=UPI0024AF27D1|nr:class I SAM-dependent methyltransferase [Asticcacaulis sp. EMRT-3]MDI7776362.1 class I SAM-dependent methyltransferase [Asticcacaulis sp. EMRT-3]